MGFPDEAVGKEATCQCRRHRRRGLIPRTGRYTAAGNGNPLQYPAWKIPWTEGPGGLQSIGLQRVR